MDGADDGARAAERRYELIRRARRLSSRLPGGWDRWAREVGKALIDYRGARRAAVRRVVFRGLGRASPVLAAPFGQARLLVDSNDGEIGRVVFAHGDYERVYMATALDELDRLGCGAVRERTFVDVGANIGTSTIDALVNFGFARAVSFEPEPQNHRLLRANVALNGLDDRAVTYPWAISDDDCDLPLQLSPVNPGDNRLGAPGAGQRGWATVTVPCRRLDTLVEEGLIAADRVGLLWLDTQGHEPSVLAGASRLTAAGVPVVLEYLPGTLREKGTLEALEDQVRRHYTHVVDLHLLAHGLHAPARFPAEQVTGLRDTYTDGEHTDLLLVRSAR